MRRNVGGHEAAERMSVKYRRLTDLFFQEADDVRRKLLPGVAAGDASGLSVSAQIEREHAPALRQVRHHVEEHFPPVGDAVQQHEWRTRLGGADVVNVDRTGVERFLAQDHSRLQTTRPPTIVASTLTSRMFRGSIAKMSSLSMTMSASLPG